MNRRTFLQLAAVLPAAPTLMSRYRTHLHEARGLESIGVQLYTVRSVLGEDFEGTIQAIAQLGYHELEFAGYYDRDPEDIRALLESENLTAPSAHVPIQALRANLEEVIDSALTLGHHYVVCPYLDASERTLEHYRAHAALFNEVGAACSEAGLQFAYHNHEFEFEETDGMIPYDLLLEETDPDLVQMELDLYWVVVAKKQAQDLFTQAPGRFPLCHIKDMGAEGKMMPVGEGNIDFAEILSHSEQAGLKHYFVEHDHPEDPMQSVATSIEHLKTLEF